MKIEKITTTITETADLMQILERERIEWQSIDCVNWPEAFPYQPKVRFRMAYSDSALLFHYQVNEQQILAEVAEDNGAIWTDSCVECFISPFNDGLYYNIEANCIGKVLIGCGKERHGRERGDKEIRDKILRWSSLGNEPFGERSSSEGWDLCLIVPFECFFKHQIQSLEGCRFKANFYKCGDRLSVPHYLSWKIIPTEKPDFHRPEFFGEIVAE